MLTCCRQSIFGKSLHSIVGSTQALSGICVLIAIASHPFGWGHERVKRMCGSDAEAFWPAECHLGKKNKQNHPICSTLS